MITAIPVRVTAAAIPVRVTTAAITVRVTTAAITSIVVRVTICVAICGGHASERKKRGQEGTQCQSLDSNQGCATHRLQQTTNCWVPLPVMPYDLCGI